MSYMNFDSPSVDVRVRRQPPRRCSSHAIGLRLPAILLLALALVGCGSGQRGSQGGYSERPPSNRTAYVAWQEWTKFGRSTVVYGGVANGYSNRNGVTERSEPLSSRVGDYWGSCGHPEWNGKTSGRPWSGAFVSWVMSHSGVSQRDFTPAGRHGTRAPVGTETTRREGTMAERRDNLMEPHLEALLAREPRIKGDMPRPELVIRPRLDQAAELGVTVTAGFRALSTASTNNSASSPARPSASKGKRAFISGPFA